LRSQILSLTPQNAMTYLISAPSQETRLETQTVFYPTLRQLVRLLPMDRKRVVEYVQEEAKHNPFLMNTPDSSAQSGGREALLEDILPDWYHPPAQGLSLQKHLSGQISVLSLPQKQRDALIYLTQWLSPSGYLEGSAESWARGTVWSPRELEAVVPALQSLDPPGIGARSLRECLLLQLKYQPQTLAFLLVKYYLEALVNCTGSSLEAKQNRELLLQKLHQNPQVSLDTNMETLTAALSQIQELEPRPARNFGHINVPIVTPDLKAERQSGGDWQVSPISEVNQRFCLNGEAIELLAKSNKRSRDTQRLEVLLQKAQNLLTALNQWQENILKVGQFLVERQQAFLNSRNKLDLVPTPQQLVAQAVGLSNATVSRIVRGRYLLICDRQNQTIALASLCVSVRVGGRTLQQVQQLLVQLIQEESPTNPYTDEQLAHLLGIRFALPIARRTVTKYRQLMSLESSHRRETDSGITQKVV